MDESFNSNEDELELLRRLQEAEVSKDYAATSEIQTKLLSRGSTKKKKPRSTRSKILDKVSQVSSKISGKTDHLAERNWKEGSVAKLLKQKSNRNPCTVKDTSNVEDLCKLLSRRRANAALVLNSEKRVVGIITDADISKRVVSKQINPDSTSIKEVMTPDPVFVNPGANILEVFSLMCKRRFRHLPVLDDNREVIYGLLDISQCLYDAITRLERVQKKQADFIRSVQRAQVHFDSNESTATNFLAQEMISHMMAKITPKISSIFFKDESKSKEQRCVLDSSITVERACQLMAENNSTAVVGIDEHECGIFTTKDLIKVISKKIPPEVMNLRDVMTKNPDSVDIDSSLLDALHMMLKGRFLHVPVVKYDIAPDGAEEETFVGILDVLDCAIHTLAALDVDKNKMAGASDDDLYNKANIDPEIEQKLFQSLYLNDDTSAVDPTSLSNSEGALNITDSVSQIDVNQMQIQSQRSVADASVAPVPSLKLKVVSSDGKKYRLDYAPTKGKLELSKLKKKVRSLLELQCELKDITLRYVDEDEEKVVISDDKALKHAAEAMVEQSWSKLTVYVSVKGTLEKLGLGSKELILIGAVSVLGLFGVMFIGLSSKSKNTRTQRYAAPGNPAAGYQYGRY